MEDLTLLIRETARGLLQSGEVELVIGWEQGSSRSLTTPAFIEKAEETERLVWNEYCSNNLAKYLLDYKNSDIKVAVFVKGCDARGVNRLLQDNQINRKGLVLIGLSCPGMKGIETEKEIRREVQRARKGDVETKSETETKSMKKEPGELKKCRECRYPDPVTFDLFLGPKERKTNLHGKKDYSKVEKVEALSPDDKYAVFSSNYAKCLRCYACRNVCPACSCRECIFGSSAKGWSGKAVNLSENMFFAMTRALHVAGRCIDCGECERICPVGIPIMLLNKKLSKDIDTLFGEYDAGIDPQGKLPLGGFEFTDPEEFM